MNIGPGRGNDGIRIRPLAIHQLAVFLQPNSDARLGIGAARDGLHGIKLQIDLMREGLPA